MTPVATTGVAAGSPAASPASHSLFAPDPRTAARNAAEARFRIYGLVAITLAILALIWLLISIDRKSVV